MKNVFPPTPAKLARQNAEPEGRMREAWPRTLDSQSSNTSSNLVGAANKKDPSFMSGFFIGCPLRFELRVLASS